MATYTATTLNVNNPTVGAEPANTNRPMPQGKSVAVSIDLGVSTVGQSGGVVKCVAGTVQLACEGFTTLAATLQRSSVDPNGPYAASAQWLNVGTALAASGIVSYAEPGVGWFRANVTALTGAGNVALNATSA